MKKIFGILSSIIFAIAMCAPGSAQNYVVDDSFADSVIVSQLTINEDKSMESYSSTGTVCIGEVVDNHQSDCSRGIQRAYNLPKGKQLDSTNTPS